MIKLPDKVEIGGKKLDTYFYLKLVSVALLNVHNHLNSSILAKPYAKTKKGFVDNVKGSLSYTEYMMLAFDVQRFMHTTRAVPDKISTEIGDLPLCNVVYLFSKLLNLHKSGNLSDYIMVYPWKVVTNKNTHFFSKDEIADTAHQIKNYIDFHHKIPSNTKINKVDMDLSSYLGILTETILYYKNKNRDPR